MAEIQGDQNWVCIQVYNKSVDVELQIRQANAKQGKFYHYDNKKNEMEAYKVNEMKIASAKMVNIAACGRESSPTGTNGSLYIYDNAGRKVCKIEWDVPYGAVNKVKFTVTEQHSDYVVGTKFIDKPNGLGNGGPGAYIGRVELKVVYTG